jgi:hypothetical protein
MSGVGHARSAVREALKSGAATSFRRAFPSADERPLTATPAVRCAQEAGIAERRGERVISNPLPPFPLALVRREGARSGPWK